MTDYKLSAIKHQRDIFNYLNGKSLFEKYMDCCQMLDREYQCQREQEQLKIDEKALIEEVRKVAEKEIGKAIQKYFK